MGKVIYGHIENAKDIGKINRLIRSDIKSAKTRSRLTELKRRSRYLITLMSSPGFSKRANVGALKRRARSEYAMTTKIANKRLKQVSNGNQYKI